MNPQISSIWHSPPPDRFFAKLVDIIENIPPQNTPFPVFFRADDIGPVDDQFRRLMQAFLLHETPLCLAVVPAWLDERSWQQMQEFDPPNQRWCWHQHGMSHTNYQQEGKKGEFGDDRTSDHIHADLMQGRKKLLDIIDDIFCPVFTPPWNRCSQATLELLAELDYMAVSRSNGAKPSAEHIIPDYAINVDLHTRRETDEIQGWENLIREFKRGSEKGYFGIMLHHQLMNEHAFDFLDRLLPLFRERNTLACVTFRELPELDILP